MGATRKEGSSAACTSSSHVCPRRGATRRPGEPWTNRCYVLQSLIAIYSRYVFSEPTCAQFVSLVADLLSGPEHTSELRKV